MPTPQQILQERMKKIEACVESIEWAAENDIGEAAQCWRLMDQPQWMAWLPPRLLGVDGARGVLVCARAAAKKAPAEANAALDHAEKALKAAPSDWEPLLEAAFTSTAVGLHQSAGVHASTLVACGYVAHCVHKLHAAKKLADKVDKTDAEKRERKRLMMRACAHAAEAALHVMIAAPALEDSLADMIRGAVSEPAMVKAFNAVKV